jgi:Protein of unknown function (DUF2442)
MVHVVKKVEYIEGYKLRLHFNDRKVKIVDLARMLKSAKNMLLPLLDVDFFKQVSCDGTTICWPNGVDLCPDVLYAMGKKPRKRVVKKKTTSIRRKKSQSQIS